MATGLSIVPYSGGMLVNRELHADKRNPHSARGSSYADMVERLDQTVAYWARSKVSAEIASSHGSITLIRLRSEKSVYGLLSNRKTVL